MIISTPQYLQHKQEIIIRFPGAADGIHSLEHSIELRPEASRVECVVYDYDIRRKSASPYVYDKFMSSKDKIVIIYGVHIINKNIKFIDIY